MTEEQWFEHMRNRPFPVLDDLLWGIHVSHEALREDVGAAEGLAAFAGLLGTPTPGYVQLRFANSFRQSLVAYADRRALEFFDARMVLWAMEPETRPRLIIE